MRRALVTGGTRGIGLAVARRLAREGWRLALAYRGDEVAAARVSRELDQASVDHVMLKADMADAAEAAALPARAAAHLGGLDALVSNAGITDDGAFVTLEAERMSRVLRTNLFGPMHLCAAALPLLRQGQSPAIVVVSSLGGVAGKEGQVPYATSKGGLIGLVQWLGSACSADGIRVNAVAPGFIETEMTQDLQQKMVGPMVNASALRRFGRADEVAQAVHFLLQPGYLQSTTLRLDGGFHR